MPRKTVWRQRHGIWGWRKARFTAGGRRKRLDGLTTQEQKHQHAELARLKREVARLEEENAGRTTGAYMFEVRWYDASGAEISGTRKAFGNRSSDTAYVQSSTQLTAPAGAVQASVRFQANKAEGVGYAEDLRTTAVAVG